MTIYIIYEIIINKNYSISSFFRIFLPISYRPLWFISTYFILYILHPFINKLILNLDKNKYKILIFITTILWCVIPTIINKNLECNDLLWFIYLYVLAGYLNLYYDNIKKKSLNKNIMLTLLTFLIDIVLIIIFDLKGKDYKLIFGLQKLPTLITALSIFILFLRINVGTNKYINNIAKCTFGIYLIHDNPYLKEFIWIKLFKVNSFYNYNSILFILNTIIIVLIVFTVCFVIEYIRKLFENKFIQEGKLLNENKIFNTEIEI